MKSILVFIIGLLISSISIAQPNLDTLQQGEVTVARDIRIDILGQKMAEHYSPKSTSTTGPTTTGWRNVNGYRLMIMTSNDRPLVMNVRQQLMQTFPDQKPYLIFQAPFIKLKFGDFTDKAEATRVKNRILAMKLVTGNIYVVPDVVTIKVGKIEDSK